MRRKYADGDRFVLPSGIVVEPSVILVGDGGRYAPGERVSAMAVVRLIPEIESASVTAYYVGADGTISSRLFTCLADERNDMERTALDEGDLTPEESVCG